jgi:hypothetical protein
MLTWPQPPTTNRLQYSAYGMLLFPLAIWLMLLAYFFTQVCFSLDL